MKSPLTTLAGMESSAKPSLPQARTALGILGVMSTSHLLNDMIQSLMIAVYPIFKGNLHLSYWALGFVTLAYQLTASLLQPFIGHYTDRRPLPFMLPMAMVFSLCGLLLLSRVSSYPGLLVAAMLVGVGSSVFHPESSRVARLASGGRHGLAQSIFQVGGNAGSAVGPLLAALIIVPRGQMSIGWFAVAAVIAMPLLWQASAWYDGRIRDGDARRKNSAATRPPLDMAKVGPAIAVLTVLMFSKYFYTVSISNYLIFYLMAKFQLGVQSAQLHLFAFLGAVALGTLAGGPLGDRFGRKAVIWFSIMGVAPFTLMLPHANLAMTTVLIVLIGFIIASAFSAILVYAQALMPGRVGMVSGLFFGFAFGLGGLGAATLGWVADHYGIPTVYRFCAYLPLIGILAVFLPSNSKSAGT